MPPFNGVRDLPLYLLVCRFPLAVRGAVQQPVPLDAETYPLMRAPRQRGFSPPFPLALLFRTSITLLDGFVTDR